MMAFGMLRDWFDRRDMGRVYHVMVEKEIRLHGELAGMEESPIKEIELPLDVSSEDDEP